MTEISAWQFLAKKMYLTSLKALWRGFAHLAGSLGAILVQKVHKIEFSQQIMQIVTKPSPLRSKQNQKYWSF